jgi:hypothetical protein
LADLNCTDFGEKTLNLTDFGEKNWFWPCFTCYLSEKIFLNLEVLSGKIFMSEKNFCPPPLANIFGGKYGTVVILDRM